MGSQFSADMTSVVDSAPYRHLREERLRWLLAFEDVLRATDAAQLSRVAVEAALPELADFGFVDVVEDAEVVRYGAAYEDPALSAMLNGTRWQRSTRMDKNLCALSSGATGVHFDIDDAWYQDIALSPEHLAVLRQLGFTSMITVPLWHAGELLGGLTLFRGRSGLQHGDEDVAAAEHAAARLAGALSQARFLAEAQRVVRIRDEFLASLSHELRTPLNVILGRAQMLQQADDGVTSLVRDSAAVLLRNATSLARLVDDLLDLSRLTLGHLTLDCQPTRIAEVIEAAVTACDGVASAKGVALRIEVDDPHQELRGDSLRLQQVFWNLVGNAIKFTSTGGVVTVRVRHERDAAVVQVSDNGSGIDAAFIPHVFDAFRQGPSRSPGAVGLGVGLSIVKRLVEMHEGTVEASNNAPLPGATFTVRLPLRGPRGAAA